MHNTIVAGNFKGTGTIPSDLDTGNLHSASHNLIGSAVGGSGGLTDGVNGNIVGVSGSGTIPTATILNPTLANNGGPTQTHAIVSNSPAVGAGDNAQALAANGTTPLTTDQRGTGFARVKNGTVDIGAFESDFTPPVAAPEVESVVINDDDVTGCGANGNPGCQRSMIKTITVTFDVAVNLAAGAFSVLNTTTNTTFAPTVTPSLDGKTASLTFSGAGIVGGSLSDGNYTLTVDKSESQCIDRWNTNDGEITRMTSSVSTATLTATEMWMDRTSTSSALRSLSRHQTLRTTMTSTSTETGT